MSDDGGNEGLAQALALTGLGKVGADGHAYLEVEALRQLSGEHAADPEWQAGFDAMIGYARAGGWLAAGPSLRAHCETRQDDAMTRSSGAARQTVSPDDFRYVIGHFASGITVVSTRHGGRPCGTTVSAVSSLSLAPPMLVICMNQQSVTAQAVSASRTFAVNILSEDQSAMAERFAGKGGDKFADVPFSGRPDGPPLLDGSLATLECRVVQQVSGGSHTVFLAEVVRARVGGGSPLAYFRGRMGRLDDELVDRASRP
ncbi:flavin reductase family protein [Streptomyces endophyticus]|uniref:Flavin reductase family protein n=1 Tax=Streptomyces endophyticus TaxID=714166 RepID=A0ABU6F9N6_9ACTN|nr:flavin reductase family protein [Streptomyces endophyticus]MEB8340213.1 flavin reductase family protein [Streptomyces endophyticus]